MLEAFAALLWLVVQPCYDLTGNWWIAILLFTVIIKLLMLPLSLWVQKSAILMVQLMPALNRINVKFFGDREAIGEAQN
ncbi:MAG: YidC/Oxa1 family membrane protein insertase, partial [Raoultibacter sp.]